MKVVFATFKRKNNSVDRLLELVGIHQHNCQVIQLPDLFWSAKNSNKRLWTRNDPLTVVGKKLVPGRGLTTNKEQSTRRPSVYDENKIYVQIRKKGEDAETDNPAEVSPKSSSNTCSARRSDVVGPPT